MLLEALLAFAAVMATGAAAMRIAVGAVSASLLSYLELAFEEKHGVAAVVVTSFPGAVVSTVAVAADAPFGVCRTTNGCN